MQLAERAAAAVGDLLQIETRGVTKQYHRGRVPVQALTGVDVTIRQGEFVAIMGQSGSGKSTLLNLLAGIDRPTSGEIRLRDRRIDRLSEAQLAILRRKGIGLVFQAFNLLTDMTALQNVLVPALLAGLPASAARLRAGAVLDQLGLEAQHNARPGQLSGGQQQRVAIARAIVNRPVVLLADEPTGNLDAQTGQEVMRLFRELHAAAQTIVLVTHDARVASYAQRVVIMRDGRIVDQTTTTDRSASILSPLDDLASPRGAW